MHGRLPIRPTLAERCKRGQTRRRQACRRRNDGKKRKTKLKKHAKKKAKRGVARINI